MSKTNYIGLFLLIGSCVISFSCFAQKKATKIELKQANTLLYDETKGSKTKKLIGDVIFKHDKTLIYCDSAYIYEKNSIDAYGKIKINEGDTLFAYCDTLSYDGNTKKAELKRNVKLQDQQITLTTNQLNFDFNSNVGSYYTGGKIIESNNVLTSKKGYYHSKKKEFFFKDQVQLVNPKYIMNSDTLLYYTYSGIANFFGPSEIKSGADTIYCENGWYDTRKEISQFKKNAKIISQQQTLTGDSIYYNGQLGIGKAFKNVVVIDTVEKIIINGDYAITFEKSDSTYVTGNAMMIQIQEKDSFFLHADTLFSVLDTAGERSLYAHHQVKFFQSDLQGKCDSIVYNFSDSLIRLFKEPVLWADKNQLTAEFIEIKTSDEGIQEMYLKNTALIISEEELNEKYNQIKGKEMRGYFFDNELKRILVTGNGQTIYYAKEDSSSYAGINRADCTNMLITLKDSEVDQITFYKKPLATLFPLGALKEEELKLDGFKWRGTEKPLSKKDIFNW